MIHNTNSSYGLISIFNHWVSGLLFLAILGMGFYMEYLPRSPLKTYLLDLHQVLSIVLMGLIAIRILWKFATPTPNIIRSYSLWEMYLAKSVHILLLISLILMPISGWILLNAEDQDLVFMQHYVLPRIVEPSPQLYTLARSMHVVLPEVIVGLIFLHLLGTIKHHLIDKDNTLKRMIKPEKFWFNR